MFKSLNDTAVIMGYPVPMLAVYGVFVALLIVFLNLSKN